MSKNIVLIVMDTARAADTQNIMEQVPGSTLADLAAKGTSFTNAFSNSPWTLPSHASMFTGTYTSKHGTHAGYKSYDGQFPTLADQLSQAGYETFGVTNNAWVTDEFGLTQGFNQFRKVWQYLQTDTDFGKIKLTSHGRDQLTDGLTALLSRDFGANLVNTVYGSYFYRRSDYGAKRTNTLIKNWLTDRNSDSPFFLFANYLEPHLDYQPPKEFAQPFLPDDATYEEAMAVPQEPWEYIVGNISVSNREFELLKALYQGEIAYLDNRIGQLRSLLQQVGEWDETVFVVVGDHGENIGDYGLMDHQYSLHDPVLHVPFVATGGPFTGNGDIDQLVQTVDLYPTLLEVANIDVPEHCQSESVIPLNETQSREHIIAEYCHPQPSIERLSEQTGVKKAELERFDKKLRMIRTKRFKLLRTSTGEVKLFDLMSSKGEDVDISQEQSATSAELESELDTWLDSFSHSSTDGNTEMKDSTKSRLEDLGYLQ